MPQKLQRGLEELELGPFDHHLVVPQHLLLKMCSPCDNKGSDNNNSCLSVENVTNKEELTSCLKLVPSTISDLGLLKESRIKSNI